MTAESAAVSRPATGGIWDDPEVVELVESGTREMRIMKLQDVCTRITDGTHKTPHYQPTGVRFISIKNIRAFQPVNWETYEKYISEDEHRALTKRCKPEFDDTLFPRIGTLGFAKRIDFAEEVSIFVGLGLLKPNKAVIRPKYLEYWMNHPLIARLSRERAAGSGRLTLPLEQSREFPIPVPPLTRQDEIVEEIDKQFSRLDGAAANLKRVDAALAQYRAAVLGEVVGAIGQWPTYTIGDLLREKIVNGLSVKESTTPTPVRALRLSAMSVPGLNYKDHRFLPVSLDSIQDILIVEGDFLVSRGNGSLALVGRGMTAREPPFPVIFPDTMMRLRFSDAEVRRWVAAIWSSRLVRRQIERRVKTTAGIYKIAQPQLASIEVPLPPTAERKRILAELDRRLSIVSGLKTQVDGSQGRAGSLRPSILARAFGVSKAQ